MFSSVSEQLMNGSWTDKEVQSIGQWTPAVDSGCNNGAYLCVQQAYPPLMGQASEQPYSGRSESYNDSSTAAEDQCADYEERSGQQMEELNELVRERRRDRDRDYDGEREREHLRRHKSGDRWVTLAVVVV